MASNVWRRTGRLRWFDFFVVSNLFAIVYGRLRLEETGVNVSDEVINSIAIALEATYTNLFVTVTGTNGILKNYTKGARVQPKDGLQMVRSMSADIEKMMAWKVQAVQRITETAEEAMLDHSYDPTLSFIYNNAKILNEEEGVQISLTSDKHFYGLNVSTTNSSIHVPTNVYDKAPLVINPILASERLNPIFESNYYLDPSLSWQYFGSSTGFLRQYPAIKWAKQPDVVDTYDCRMRPWYIEAAASAKDMVILIDGSGSMTGQRIEIAKHVVLNILDTLSDNDYFTIFRFDDKIDVVVECFNYSLVPANMENIREFKRGLQLVNTTQIANFTKALIRAFEILQEYNRSGNGSLCNQVIMLITDGAPQMYEEIFKKYNQPARHVRIFTYMIGQEMADEREVEWMACTNRGYYSHVSTIAEARDKVQEYIPVMARPLVLHQNHSVIWTSVYADIEDPKMSDFLWERLEKQRHMKFTQLQRQRNNRDDYDDESYDANISVSYTPILIETWNNVDLDNPVDEKPTYRLMTTVACPVFDRRNSTNEIMHKGFWYRSAPRLPENRERLSENGEKCVACILGVAGTDVPIEEITKLAPAYKLGVNGYSFAITNNGYILFHPDLRPVYHDDPQILKPDYNSVDLTEVELVNNDLLPREIDSKLLMLRKKMIDRDLDQMQLEVKVHMDSMRRVVTRVQHYFFAPLKDTPFSFGISMPKGYGMNEVVGMEDLKKLSNSTKYPDNVLSLFKGNNWRIHPDWIYCRYLYGNSERPEWTPEKNLLHFLRQPHNCKHHRVKPLPKNEDYSYDKAKKINKNEFYCDCELMQSLVFDANATKALTQPTAPDKNENTARQNGVVVSFVATRSGFTRWKEFDPEGRNFIVNNSRAIDELWYKRAVDFYWANVSYVFSVPYDAGSFNDSLITISHAIFLHHKNGAAAPAAVVGLQIRRSSLLTLFKKTPGIHDRIQCKDSSNCRLDCDSVYLNCYLLDDNGFVILSEDNKNTGQFYGQVDFNVMSALVADGIYRRIQMVDYQAVCSEEVPFKNSASLLLKPIVQLKHLLTWMWSKIVFFYVNYNLYSLWKGKGHLASASNNYDDSIFPGATLRDRLLKILNKTRPEPCDKEYDLYKLQFQNLADKRSRRGSISCFNSREGMHYAAHVVNKTNLLLLIVNVTNQCQTRVVTLGKKEIIYNDTCHWLSYNIYRRRPEQCISYHEQELEIEGQCGRSSPTVLSRLTILACALSLISFRWLYDWHVGS